MVKRTTKTELETLPTYLAAIRGSIGCRMFQHLYVRQGRRLVDATEGGRVACGYYVAALLHLFGLVAEPHATVSGTIRDMEKSGWRKIAKPRIGAVLVWEPLDRDGSVNRHIGFYVGRGQAVSNSSRHRVIATNHWTYGRVAGRPKRRVEGIYWHRKLGK